MLDCFCGLGGASEGFVREGFDVTGIDIVNGGYPYELILADMRDLKGEDFRGYDVIWGSPPCRDFSQIGLLYGKKWKNPPNPENGIALIKCFLKFVENAEPRIWIMENVALLKKYFRDIQPKTETYITLGKRHVFYGNYPLFLMPHDMRIRIRKRNKNGRDEPNYMVPVCKRNRSQIHAKIPLPCSRAFARACKEKLLEVRA